MRVYSCLERFFASSSLIPVQPPSKMETHLWYISPDEVRGPSLLNQYLDLLSPCELENISRMHGQLKKRALLARTLVRTTIARYQINSQVSPRSLKFRKNIYGKPEVEWQHGHGWSLQPLHFNISHTPSLIACGVTRNAPIGIDVESKQRRIKNNILAFAQRYLSPSEVELLAGISDPEDQRQQFLKLWTLKEAYVKALGRGFSGAPFKTFSILRAGIPFQNCDSKASEIVVHSLDGSNTQSSNWQFALLELAGSHYAAICTETDSCREGRGTVPMNLNVWKTIPLVGDECVSGTDAVIRICGLV